jgi:hypothetical protein
MKYVAAQCNSLPLAGDDQGYVMWFTPRCKAMTAAGTHPCWADNEDVDGVLAIMNYARATSIRSTALVCALGLRSRFAQSYGYRIRHADEKSASAILMIILQTRR